MDITRFKLSIWKQESMDPAPHSYNLLKIYGHDIQS